VRLRIKNASTIMQGNFCGRRQRGHQGSGAAACKGVDRGIDLGGVGQG
jgi:hypothetical protein